MNYKPIPQPPLDAPEGHVCFDSPYSYCDDGDLMQPHYQTGADTIVGKCVCPCHQEPDPCDLAKASREV